MISPAARIFRVPAVSPRRNREFRFERSIPAGLSHYEGRMVTERAADFAIPPLCAAFPTSQGVR
jgi:hypothetical protein